MEAGPEGMQSDAAKVADLVSRAGVQSKVCKSKINTFHQQFILTLCL